MLALAIVSLLVAAGSLAVAVIALRQARTANTHAGIANTLSQGANEQARAANALSDQANEKADRANAIAKDGPNRQGVRDLYNQIYENLKELSVLAERSWGRARQKPGFWSSRAVDRQVGDLDDLRAKVREDAIRIPVDNIAQSMRDLQTTAGEIEKLRCKSEELSHNILKVRQDLSSEDIADEANVFHRYIIIRNQEQLSDVDRELQEVTQRLSVGKENLTKEISETEEKIISRTNDLQA